MSAVVLSMVACGSSNGDMPDTNAPVITLNGKQSIQVAFNAVFADLGADAIDDIDGVVPVTVTGDVDTSLAGTYELTYSAEDSKGNSTSIVRSVLVQEDALLTATITQPPAPFSFFFDGVLIGADYWSEEPKILSAGVGFADIVGVDAPELTEEVVRQIGGAWSSDINCGDDTRNYTASSTQAQVGIGFIQQTPYGELRDGAIAIDGLPIVLSWPIDTRTLSLTDFQFTLNTGDIVRPLAVSTFPNFEDNERNVPVVFGEWANRLPSDHPDSRFPIKLEIVADDTPLMMVGPDGQLFNAVGLTWETNTSPYDENNGPRLVGAKLNRIDGTMAGESVSGIPNPAIRQAIWPNNDASVMYGEGDFMLRILTTGGFSPDGVSGVKPNDFERFFRIHAIG